MFHWSPANYHIIKVLQSEGLSPWEIARVMGLAELEVEEAERLTATQPVPAPDPACWIPYPW